MEYSADVQYFINKCMLCGVATVQELRDVTGRYGEGVADMVAEELDAAGVRFVDDDDIPVTSETNALMNGITLPELVSVAIQLPVAAKIRRHLYRRVVQQRSFELDLRRLDYLGSDYEWFYLSPSLNRFQRAIRALLDSGRIPFSSDWRSWRGEQQYVSAIVAHPLFKERISPRIREDYLRLRAVRAFVGWIRATGKEAPAMVDIICAGLAQGDPGMVREVLLSEHGSTADDALRRRRDVCFSCPPKRRCLGLQGVDDPRDVLARYRYTDVRRLLELRYPGEDWETCFGKDSLLAKFFVPYSIATTAKRWMLAIGLLEDRSVVLDKSHGMYCPKEDVWELTAGGQTASGGNVWPG